MRTGNDCRISGGTLSLHKIEAMADEKIIFSMNGVGKILPHNNKVILKDIYLSFFYGAKIGIIGLNGSGKSTLMKIIAGVEKSYQGEVVWAPGYSVGYLEQEPQMDPDKTVIEVVQEGVGEVMALLKEYEQVNMKFAAGCCGVYTQRGREAKGGPLPPAAPSAGCAAAR